MSRPINNKLSAPFYTGNPNGDSLGDLVLTGLETPPFIAGTILANPSASEFAVRGIEAPAAVEPSAFKKYLPWTIGAAVVAAGGFYAYKRMK
jgi:hypothetical protein